MESTIDIESLLVEDDTFKPNVGRISLRQTSISKNQMQGFLEKSRPGFFK
jgi:hypothetical protein